jgi:hypothetical protein
LNWSASHGVKAEEKSRCDKSGDYCDCSLMLCLARVGNQQRNQEDDQPNESQGKSRGSNAYHSPELQKEAKAPENQPEKIAAN